jgi:hypothetical protein
MFLKGAGKVLRIAVPHHLADVADKIVDVLQELRGFPDLDTLQIDVEVLPGLLPEEPAHVLGIHLYYAGGTLQSRLRAIPLDVALYCRKCRGSALPD